MARYECEVLQEDIDAGSHRACTCPVALAIRRATGARVAATQRLIVFLTGDVLTGDVPDSRSALEGAAVATPEEVSAWIDSYDHVFPYPDPFSFTLYVPENA